MKRRLSFCLFLTILSLNSVYTQTTSSSSLEGVWEGTYSYLNQNYPITFDFTKISGDKVEGTVSTYKNDSASYTTYSFDGSIKDNTVSLKGKKFIESKGLWCLPTFDLTLLNVNNQWLLEGRWKPNLRLGGCVVGASGRISLLKKQPAEVITRVEVRNDNSALKAEDDPYTAGMVKGLKERDYHALIIGVNEYADASLLSLDNPVKDGQALMNTLNAYYHFEKNNIAFLQSPGRAEILDQMQRISQQLDDHDNLLIFYAGHGIWDEDLEQGYWLPGDASLDSRSQWISNSTIRDYIRSLKTKHVLLISDACFSGGLLKERGVGKAMMNVYNMPSRKALTSGTLTTVPDNSVFMKYLIKYLEENQEPLISADQIFYQIKIAVINNSPTNQVPQYGPIHQANDEGGEFVFLRDRQ